MTEYDKSRIRQMENLRSVDEDAENKKILQQKVLIQFTVAKMISKFGEDSQIDVAIEEMSELIKELIKYKRSKIHSREKQAASREHVVEEIGDVMFMIEYLKKIFNIADKEIHQIVYDKSVRTEERYLNVKD